MAELDAKIELGYDTHSRLSEYDRLVYPVVSRRAGGLSLGINLNPDKRCNFDCVYCQVERPAMLPPREPDLGQLEGELRDWLGRLATGDYQGYRLLDISLAGDGEPTSVKGLPRVLELLLALKAEFALEEVKLVLFTNGSGLDRNDLAPWWPKLFAAGAEVWFKLDYWDQASLERINRTRLRFDRLLAKLKAFSRHYPVVLQSCFFRWQGQPYADDQYDGYVALVRELLSEGGRLTKIQAYTLARRPAEPEAQPWADSVMDRLAARLRGRLALPVELFYATGSEADRR